MFRGIEQGVWADVARECQSFRIGVVLAEAAPDVGNVVFRMNFVEAVYDAGTWRRRRYRNEERAAMHVILGAILQGPAAPRLPRLTRLLVKLRQVFLEDVWVGDSADSGVYEEEPPNKFRGFCVIARDFVRALIFLRKYLRERREDRFGSEWKILLDSCIRDLTEMISAL